MTSRWWVVMVMVVALGAGCGEEQARGTRGGACYADNTCDPGLVCAYDECIIGNTAPVCGDGVVNTSTGEQCDDGAANGDDRDCRADCKLNICGDGSANTGGPARVEACDDGNEDNADGCSTSCALPSCGNGVTERDEACDDGNDDELDGCTSSCAYTQQAKVCLDGTSGHGTSVALTPFTVLGAATIELWYRSADPETPAAATVDLVHFHPAAYVGDNYPGVLVELATASAVNMPSLSGRVLLVGVDARGGPQNELNVRGFDIDASIPGFDEKGWHHYAVVFTGTTTRAFIDGVELTSTVQRDGSAAATFASAFGPTFATTYGDLFMSVGYFARDDIRYARGGFRELRVSKIARYSAGFTPAFRHVSDANTGLLLPMNENAGTVSTDRSGSGYDVTWSGGVTRSELLRACP